MKRPKNPWLRPWGWFYRPVSWQGSLVVAVTGALAAHFFVALDRSTHSTSDTLYAFFPYAVACGALAYWVAARTNSDGK